jgi:hypothetical protein
LNLPEAWAGRTTVKPSRFAIATVIVLSDIVSYDIELLDLARLTEFAYQPKMPPNIATNVRPYQCLYHSGVFEYGKCWLIEK